MIEAKRRNRGDNVLRVVSVQLIEAVTLFNPLAHANI